MADEPVEPVLGDGNEDPAKVVDAVRYALEQVVDAGRGDFFLDRDGRWTLHAHDGKLYAKGYDDEKGEDVLVHVEVRLLRVERR